MPEYETRMDGSGNVSGVEVNYPKDLMKQMLGYSKFTREAKREAAGRMKEILAGN